MPLTAKQQRFISEYLVDLNATQAAIRAGYSAKTAYSIGEENLRKPEIAAALKTAIDEQIERTGISADRVLGELAKIGFSDIRKAVKWFSQANIAAIDDAEGEIEDGSIRFAVANQVELISSADIADETAAAISEISMTDKGGLKIKFHDKRAALVDLGRHLKLFTDKVEHGADPALTEAITKAMSPKKAADTFRDELG
jgi:phage terminase small subunit